MVSGRARVGRWSGRCGCWAVRRPVNAGRGTSATSTSCTRRRVPCSTSRSRASCDLGTGAAGEGRRAPGCAYAAGRHRHRPRRHSTRPDVKVVSARNSAHPTNISRGGRRAGGVVGTRVVSSWRRPGCGRRGAAGPSARCGRWPLKWSSYSDSASRAWRWLMTRIRSKSSRRMLPTNRSAMAFARGARTGVLMIWIPASAKTASNMAVNLASRSRMRNRKCRRASRSMARLRASWVSRVPVGWAVTPRMWTWRVACSTTKNA